MPNHITNYVEIKGAKEQMAELVLHTLTEEKDGHEAAFDFNGIIPMPEELDITSGSDTWLGMACFDDKQFTQYRAYQWFAGRYPGVDKPAQLRTVLEEQQPKVVELGRQAMENIERFGAPTWYEWCCNNWGTKWGAYEVSILHRSDERLVLIFDTAWSPPEPIFDKLVEQGFEVNCYWQDEDVSNFGEYGEPWSAFSRHIEYEFAG